jgi:hypothetical protein
MVSKNMAALSGSDGSLRSIPHYQGNHTLFADHVQNDLRHWSTRRRCDHCLIILNREKQPKMKNQPRTAEILITTMISTGKDIATLWNPRLYACLHQILKMDEKTDRLCAMYACHSVLSQEGSDDGDVSGACSLRPFNTIDTSTIDER